MATPSSDLAASSVVPPDSLALEQPRPGAQYKMTLTTVDLNVAFIANYVQGNRFLIDSDTGVLSLDNSWRIFSAIPRWYQGAFKTDVVAETLRRAHEALQEVQPEQRTDFPNLRLNFTVCLQEGKGLDVMIKTYKGWGLITSQIAVDLEEIRKTFTTVPYSPASGEVSAVARAAASAAAVSSV